MSQETTKAIAGLTTLVNKGLTQNQIIADIESLLSEAKKVAKRIWESEIPEAMFEVGLKELTTTDGYKVEIKEVIAASITEKNREDAMNWLRHNGHGGMIKTNVSAQIPPDDDSDVLRNLIELVCERNGVTYTSKEDVHHSTLKAWIKSCKEEGVEVPPELFGVYEFNIAVVTGKPR